VSEDICCEGDNVQLSLIQQGSLPIRRSLRQDSKQRGAIPDIYREGASGALQPPCTRL